MISSVLVLAAGRGTRLNNLTSTTPKPLLMVGKNGESILDRILTQVNSVFPEIPVFVNFSYQPNVFISHFKSYTQGKRPRFLYELNLLGPAKTIKASLGLLGEYVLVIHGDLVLSDSVLNHLSQEINQFKGQIMMVHSRKLQDARSIVSSAEGIVETIEEVSLKNSSLDKRKLVDVFSGIVLISTKILMDFSPLDGEGLSPNLLQHCSAKEKMKIVRVQGKRFSVESEETLINARNFLSRSS